MKMKALAKIMVIASISKTSRIDTAFTSFGPEAWVREQVLHDDDSTEQILKNLSKDLHARCQAIP